MNALPQYERYWDSGISWMGEIPAHWQLRRAKFIVNKIGSGKTPTGGAVVYVDDGIMLIRSQNVYDDGLRLDEVVYITEEADKLQAGSRVKPNDVLLNITGASIGRASLVPEGFVSANVNQHVCIFRPKPEIVLPEFLHLLFCSQTAKNQILTSEIGTSREGLNFQQAGNLLFPLPPLDEQARIAAFLDAKTAEIDAAIAKKARLIQLLHEQKAILINRAVTRGLNPAVPLRDSGVPWIGEVPAHWEVKRAKFIFDEIDERSQTGEEELLSVSHMTGVTPRSEKNVNMFMAEDYSGSKLCRQDDLVFNIMWAWMGALGVSDRTGIVSPSYGVYRQKTLDTFNAWYLEHLLRSTEYVAEYNRRSTGLHSSRLRLYPDMFLDMEIAIPPIDEQNQIAAQMIEQGAVTDEAVRATEQQIDRLNEFRSILIAEAVTGKIKVS